MTAPTQAQIEAARKLLRNLSCFSDEVCSLLPCKCIEEALTAVAEVDGDKKLNEAAMLISAAEEMERMEAATIERCAQVVENFDLSLEYRVRDTIKAIAAAIRALKDKP